MKQLTPCLLVISLALFPVYAQTVPPAKDAPAVKADLPVTRVVLFSSGVGYFEHKGTIAADATVQLSFKTDQINDILKSLIVMSDHSQIAGINYASKEPLLRAIKSFAIDLSGQPTLADLLRQVRGNEVTVMAPEKVMGKIISVETETEQVVQNGAPVVLTKTFLNLNCDGTLKKINLGAAQGLTLSDPKLQAELTKALELLAGARETEAKPVDIHFTGQGQSTVRLGYVLEMPVWRTSYRLDLSDKTQLQGWAITENTSDHDWNNVALSLVSSRPISFVMDLYTPLFVNRPLVVPELYASLRPQTYDEGIATKKELAEKEMNEKKAAEKPSNAPAEPSGGGIFGSSQGGGESGINLLQGAIALASATKVGEATRYDIVNPVNLPRRTSALLPILNAAIEARKVSIYNASVLSNHPLLGAYLTNNTELTLLGGPITVFESAGAGAKRDSLYAGDAQIDTFSPGEKRFISYAIDLSVTVDSSEKDDQAIAGAKIVHGVLTLNYLHTFTQEYSIKNTSDKERSLVIEQPFDDQRKLLEPKEALEKTPELYRFETKVPARNGDKPATFTVRERQTIGQEVRIAEQAPAALVVYVHNGEIPEKVRKALQGVIDTKGELARMEAQLTDTSAQKAQLEQGQERLRKNIETAGKDSQLGQRYLKKLSEQEDQIEKFNKDIDALRKQAQDQRNKLQDDLSKLEVE